MANPHNESLLEHFFHHEEGGLQNVTCYMEEEIINGIKNPCLVNNPEDQKLFLRVQQTLEPIFNTSFWLVTSEIFSTSWHQNTTTAVL